MNFIEQYIIPKCYDIIQAAIDNLIDGAVGKDKISCKKHNKKKKIETVDVKRKERTVVLFDSYGEAKDCVRWLNTSIAEDGFVTVAEYKYYAGSKPRPIDSDFGWDKKIITNIVSTKNGYKILLPKEKAM